MSAPKYTIGVVTPYLSHFIFGELSIHLRLLAQSRGVNLVMIRANGYGHYEQPLALDLIDGLLVILNSASHKLIEQAQAKEIPIVSTADDYAGMGVEQVSSDQAQGIRDAFDHLVKQGHRHIGYAGGLTDIVDTRTRYLAYRERLKRWQLPYNKEWSLHVQDLNLAGGREAGRLYLEGKRECTAMVCATDFLAIGLIEQIKKSGIRVPEDLAIIGVDNTTLGSTHKPALTSVDQGIEALSRAAFDRLCDRIQGARFQENPIIIPQTLIVRESCGAPLSQRCPKNATLLRQDQGDERSENLIHSSEPLMAIAQSGTDSVLNLSSLYGPFISWGCFALNHSSGAPELLIREFFSATSEDVKLAKENSLHCPSERYPPPNLFDHSLPEHFVITLVPTNAEKDHPWGTLAVVDTLERELTCGQLQLFNNYLDLLSVFLERDALLGSVQKREQKAKDLAKQLEAVANTSNDGIWDWDLTTNEVEWNNRLLEMLGFTDESERKRHRHMNLFDRIHPEDENQIRSLITAHIHEGAEFRATFRLLSSNYQYLWVEAAGEMLKDSLGNAARFVGSMTDITEQRLSQQRIQHMAYHDPLTGLPNRAMLNEKLKSHIRNTPHAPLAVMLMDLDRFKFINDTYGHDTGDALLRHVAETLQPVLRNKDFLARFGGDEFVFVCNMEQEQQALELANRILSALSRQFEHKGIELSTRGSMGIAFYPKDGKSADDLIKKSDIAMYRAKRIEHASIMLYNSGMNADIQLQATLEQQLKLALEKGAIDVHFQPQISPLSGRLLGVEALARWHHETLGHVSPATFIETAEVSGLMEELGRQIALKAMGVVNRWQKKYPQQTLKLSINVSPGQLMLPGFIESFLSWQQEASLAPELITIEITETAAISDLKATHRVLQYLSEKGFSISLDDFGTGYSSLSLLKQLPLDWIKIDRSFVCDLETHSASQEIIRSIVMVCHSFGYQTVVEGVETEGQLEIVKDIGCDWVQGYVYSKPLSAEEFEQTYLHNSLADQESASTDLG